MPHDERMAAMTRLLDYYLTTAVAAVRSAGQESRVVQGHRQGLVAWPGPIPDVGAPDRAAAWLAAERSNLVQSCLHAARRGWPRHAVALAIELQAFFDNGYDQDGLAVQTAALAAAESMGHECHPGDVAGLALCLSTAHRRAGELDACRSLAERTLAEYTRLGDVTGAIGSLVNIGAVHDWQGRFDDAYGCFVGALELARSADLAVQEGRMLMSLATLHGRRERFDIAADYALQAAAVFEKAGERLLLAESRHGAAFSLASLGQHDEASAMAEEALAIHLDHGGPMQRGVSMITYGLVLERIGRHAEAIEFLSGAVALGRDADSLMVTVQALNALGEALCSAGDHLRAIESHTEAGGLAERFGDLLEVACAEEGLGNAHDAAGEADRAREHWTRASQIYADLGHPAAARLEQQLARVAPD
jgi:tetratricopeptide (TPR) repeat protein